jgi:hypothetical protein
LWFSLIWSPTPISYESATYTTETWEYFLDLNMEERIDVQMYGCMDGHMAGNMDGRNEHSFVRR